MPQIVRPFSVTLSDAIVNCYDNYTAGQSYDVLAMDIEDDEDTLVLIADDQKKFRWVTLAECRLA